MKIGVKGPRDVDRILAEVVEAYNGQEGNDAKADYLMEAIFKAAMIYALIKRSDGDENDVFLQQMREVIEICDAFIQDARAAGRLIPVRGDWPETVQ